MNEEFESLWIEIENHPKENILCAIIYGLPNSNPRNFLKTFIETIDKAENESKYCYNVNLLNYHSNIVTQEFVNSMNSFFYQPHITYH